MTPEQKQKRREHHRIYMKTVWYPKNRKKHMRLVKQANYKRIEAWKNYKKSLSCSVCSESTPECLDFHHQYGEKGFNIAGVVRNHHYGATKMMNELKKCIVLCANCHRKFHAGKLVLQ